MLVLQNMLDDWNDDVRINSANDPSRSVINFVGFCPVTP